MKRRKSKNPPNSASLLNQHAKIARGSLRDLLLRPAATCITTLVIGFALLFPVLLYLISLNISASLGEDFGPARFSVYLETGLTEPEATEVSNHLQTLASFDSATLVAPQQALNEFSENANLGNLLATLPDNPLPYTLLLSLRTAETAELEDLIRNMESQTGVAAVRFDLLWVERIQSITGLLNSLGLVLLVVVLAGLVAIVGNTIRLAVADRQQEIRVIKLVGGTDAYIARPFLYKGLFLGLGGAILAGILITVVWWMLSGPVAELSQLYGGQFELASLSVPGFLLLLLLGSGTGWIAAFFTSWWNIAAIEP